VGIELEPLWSNRNGEVGFRWLGRVVGMPKWAVLLWRAREGSQHSSSSFFCSSDKRCTVENLARQCWQCVRQAGRGCIALRSFSSQTHPLPFSSNLSINPASQGSETAEDYTSAKLNAGWYSLDMAMFQSHFAPPPQ